MDLGDLIWNSSQDGNIREISEQIAQLRREHEQQGGDSPELAAENMELKLRLCLLVRLLINKGLITAQEYANLIAESRPRAGG